MLVGVNCLDPAGVEGRSVGPAGSERRTYVYVGHHARLFPIAFRHSEERAGSGH